MDHARYQRCTLGQTLAHTLGRELLSLPASAPNLKLLERLWQFVKKLCLYSQYYPDRASFQHAILNCLAQAPTHHKAELDPLLTLRCQTFTAVPVVGENPQVRLSPVARRLEKEVLSMAA